jgi:hypothetical protein
VQGKETAAVVHNPDGLLLRVGYPFHGRFVVAVGQFVSRDGEKLMVTQGICVESGDVFDESGGDILADSMAPSRRGCEGL